MGEKQKEAQKHGKASNYIAGDYISTVDIQVWVTLWFFGDAFPHPPQHILQDLKGQLPWVQAWFDRVHARPACVAAREYREMCMKEQPTAQSNAANVPVNGGKKRKRAVIENGGSEGLGLDISH